MGASDDVEKAAAKSQDERNMLSTTINTSDSVTPAETSSHPVEASFAARMLNAFKLPSSHAGFSVENYGNPNRANHRILLANVFRLGPLSGLLSMLVAMLSIFASLGILAGSNGQEATSWRTPPSTYLAIFTAIANLCVRYAVTIGVVISWWIRSMKGSTLANLHRDWRTGTKFHAAVLSGHRMGLLGLACIASTIVVGQTDGQKPSLALGTC